MARSSLPLPLSPYLATIEASSLGPWMSKLYEYVIFMRIPNNGRTRRMHQAPGFPDLSTRHLRAIVALARSGKFVAAAADRHLPAQPQPNDPAGGERARG